MITQVLKIYLTVYFYNKIGYILNQSLPKATAKQYFEIYISTGITLCK